MARQVISMSPIPLKALGSVVSAGLSGPSGSTDVTVRGLPAAQPVQVVNLPQTGTDSLPWVFVCAGAALVLLAFSLLVMAGRGKHGTS